MLLAALASSFVLVAGSGANASYTYTTGPVTASAPPASVTDTFASRSGSVASDVAVGRALVTVTYTTVPVTPISFSQTISFTETLVSSLGNNQVFLVTGTLNVLSASTVGVAATFTNVTVTSQSGSGFSLSPTGYTDNLTVPNSGDIGFNIVPPTAVPEPASLAMLCLGLAGVGGVMVRRRSAK
jgi:hypothetical protein